MVEKNGDVEDVPSTVTWDTLRRALHRWGFSYNETKKTIYFDGHERADVKEARTIYVTEMSQLEKRVPKLHIKDPSSGGHSMYDQESDILARGERPVMLWFHDEVRRKMHR